MEDAHYCQTDSEDAVGVSTYDGGADDGTKSYRQTYTAALMFSLSISFFFKTGLSTSAADPLLLNICTPTEEKQTHATKSFLNNTH